jgi:hypothetical protein
VEVFGGGTVALRAIAAGKLAGVEWVAHTLPKTWVVPQLANDRDAVTALAMASILPVSQVIDPIRIAATVSLVDGSLVWIDAPVTT